MFHAIKCDKQHSNNWSISGDDQEVFGILTLSKVCVLQRNSSMSLKTHTRAKRWSNIVCQRETHQYSLKSVRKDRGCSSIKMRKSHAVFFSYFPNSHTSHVQILDMLLKICDGGQELSSSSYACIGEIRLCVTLSSNVLKCGCTRPSLNDCCLYAVAAEQKQLGSTLFEQSG